MKGNKAVYRPLMEIVNDALDRVQVGMHRQYQFMSFGMKYAEEVTVDYGKDIRTVRVNWKPWKAIELPVDCVDWVLVGVQDGEDVKTFVRNDYISLVFDKDANGVPMANPQPQYFSDTQTELPTFADYMFPYLNLTPLGEDPGKLYGLVSKDNGLGFFTENRNKDVSELQFSGKDIDMTKPVYLMYISNVFNLEKETMIHPHHAEFIVAGILKEYYWHDRNATVTQKQSADDEFSRQTLKVLDRNWDLRVEDIYQYLIYAGYQLTPKIP